MANGLPKKFVMKRILYVGISALESAGIKARLGRLASLAKRDLEYNTGTPIHTKQTSATTALVRHQLVPFTEITMLRLRGVGNVNGREVHNYWNVVATKTVI